MAKLTEKRKADRETMTRMVEALANKYGWKNERCEFNNSLQTRVNLTGQRGLSVGIEFESQTTMPDNYCLAWHFDYKIDENALLSDAFGSYQGSPINNTHRRKCTAFARGIDTLLDKLEVAMQMAANDSPFGDAFAPAPAFIMKNHVAYHPAGAWHYVLYDNNMTAPEGRVMLPDDATAFAEKHGLKSVSPIQMHRATS